jgi:hypothetical protein
MKKYGKIQIRRREKKGKEDGDKVLMLLQLQMRKKGDKLMDRKMRGN